jgi:hypothetical protein
VFTRWQLGIHFQRADFGHWTLACDQQWQFMSEIVERGIIK